MDTKRGKPIVEDLRREINRRRAKEKEEKYNYLNNKVETRNVSNIRVKLKKMKLHDEEEKKKMNKKNKKKKKVSKNFWTDVISKKKLKSTAARTTARPAKVQTKQPETQANPKVETAAEAPSTPLKTFSSEEMKKLVSELIKQEMEKIAGRVKTPEVVAEPQGDELELDLSQEEKEWLLSY